MKTTSIHVILFSLMVFSPKAQTTFDKSQINRAIMREFTGENLQTMMDTNPQRLEKIILYFNESFQVKDHNCLECVVDYRDLFDLSLFNIVDYEAGRLDNQESSFIFKEKYLITLLSKSDLNNLIGGITPFELVNGLPERPFPSWVSSGNDQLDFESYKVQLQLWSTDFPKQYRQKKKSATILKVRFIQFIEMTAAEKTAVETFPGGYIIVDEDIMNYPQ